MDNEKSLGVKDALVRISSQCSMSLIVTLEQNGKPEHSQKTYLALPQKLFLFENEQTGTVEPGQDSTPVPIPKKVELKPLHYPSGQLKEDVEYLRQSICPLVKIFADRFENNNGHVQEYYGVRFMDTKSELAVKPPGMYYALTEFCDGYRLDDFMRQEPMPDSWTVLRYAKQLLQGLAFLHEGQIVHQDIKGANVIVSPDRKSLKIVGLRKCKHFSESTTPPQFLQKPSGIVPFVSPEMAALSVTSSEKLPDIGRKTDIWSLGCVVIQMMQKGHPPYLVNEKNDDCIAMDSSSTYKELNERFRSGYRIRHPEETSFRHVCENLGQAHRIVGLLNRCLVVEPKLRFSASDLITSPSYSKVSPTLRNTEIQRFLIHRYRINPRNQTDHKRPCIEAVNNGSKQNAETDRNRSKPIEADREEVRKIEEAIVRSDTNGHIAAAVSVSVISAVGGESDDQDIQDKRKVYEVLRNQLRYPEQNVLRHFAVEAFDVPVKLMVFTEGEGDTETIASMIRKMDVRHLIPDFTAQILNGLALLHQHGVVHKDIRSSNILVRNLSVTGAPQYQVKIAHFEKASHFDGYSTPRHLITVPEGSSQFASKEVQELLSLDPPVKPETVGPATDIYSLGCTVIEMFQRVPPRWMYSKDGTLFIYNFQPENYAEDLRTNLRNLLNYGANPDCDQITVFGGDKDAFGFVRSCLTRPAFRRPTAARLKGDNFVTQANKSADQLAREKDTATTGSSVKHGALQWGSAERCDTPDSSVVHTVPGSDEQPRVVGMVAGGHGGYIHRAYCRRVRVLGDQMVAAKSILLSLGNENHHELEMLEKRTDEISKLRHPNIVRYFHGHKVSLVRYGTLPPGYTICMEFCEGGSLDTFLKKSETSAAFAVAPATLQKWTRQLVEGLSYLHLNGFIHRDIKSSNILLTSRDAAQSCLKIGDLDDVKRLLKDITQSREVSHGKGTWAYMSPEMITGEDLEEGYRVGRKTDIWSLGCVVIHMLTGRLPEFHKTTKDGQITTLRSDMAVMYFIGTGGLPTVSEELPFKIKDFIRKCLIRNPSDRPSANDMFNHPFLTASEKELESWVIPHPF